MCEISGFFRIYCFSVLFYVLHSMHAWFMLGIPKIWYSIFFLLITIVALTKRYFKFSTHLVPIFTFFLMFVWMKITGSLFGIIEGGINAFLFATILSLKEKYILSVLQFVTKSLSVILLISIIGFFLYKIGLPLPSTRLNTTDLLFGTNLNNFYLFVYNLSPHTFARFQSVFLEPGYLTLGVAPLLFLHKYDVRNKQVLILLFAQLLSFSLAGYIILVVGYIFSSLCSSEKGKYISLLYGLALIVIILMVMALFLGQDFFQTMILDRLQIVDGSLAGDDRSSAYLDFQYEKMMLTDDKWFGIGYDADFSDKGVSGYKLFVVQHGILGGILVVLAYISSVRKVGLNYNTGLVFVTLLMLYQNSYPDSMCVLFPIACAYYQFKRSSEQAAKYIYT